jgi:hypothetical protein
MFTKLISAITTFLILGLAFSLDLGASFLQKIVDRQANAAPYVLLVILFNMVIVALLFLLVWLILVRANRSIPLSIFLFAITAGFAFLLPILIVDPSIHWYILKRDFHFLSSVVYPMIATGPRSYLAISATFIFGIGIVNLFRKTPLTVLP